MLLMLAGNNSAEYLRQQLTWSDELTSMYTNVYLCTTSIFSKERRLKASHNQHVSNHLSKCLTCRSACCRYITVKIPGPRSILDYDNLHWQLSHRDVQVFRDSDGWHLLINNKCINLKSDGKCGIYTKRPFACRDHSSDACEYDAPIAQWSAQFFENAEALDAFCRKKYKKWDKRFIESR